MFGCSDVAWTPSYSILPNEVKPFENHCGFNPAGRWCFTRADCQRKKIWNSC